MSRTLTASQQSPTITLYRGWLDSGRHVWSPFVTRLELRLRMGGINYTPAAGSPPKAPRGKIPYVDYQDSVTDQVISLSDSTLVAKKLTEDGLLPDLNANLSPNDKTLDLGIRAMLEDRLYFYHIKERWFDNYYTMRDHALCNLPYPVRVFVGILIARNQATVLQGQGTGRFTDDELAQFKTEIWTTISELLQTSRGKASSQGLSDGEPFWVLGGDGPTEADTTLFGFIVSVLVSRAGPDSQKIVKGFPVLLEYAERIHDRYFPDYEKWETA